MDKPMSAKRNLVEIVARNGEKILVTPSTALLARRLGIAPIPRMLTASEIELLRQCVKETYEVLREIDESKKKASKT